MTDTPTDPGDTGADTPTDPGDTDADTAAHAGEIPVGSRPPDQPVPPPPAPDGARPRRLRRDDDHRILGGVAAGLARYLDIDVVVVRIVFAALALLAGFGVTLYVLGWLLIPAAGEDEALVQQWSERRPSTRNVVVLVVGLVVAVVAVSDLFSAGPWWPHPDGGVGLVLGGLALGVALALVMGSGGNRSAASRLRWLLLTVTLSVVGVVLVAAATLFSVEAASGVPLRGGIGSTQWHPTTAHQLSSPYRLAVGNLDVDLSAVTFPAGTTRVTASVGIGRLVVVVPPGPSVTVVAHSGLGDVQVFGGDQAGWDTVQTLGVLGSSTKKPAPHLVVDADTGVGQVQVLRASAGLAAAS